MNATWYRVNKYANKITTVEVVSETAKFVTLAAEGSFWKKEQRVAKGDEYFPTFAEARQYLMTYHTRSREMHKREMESHDQKWLKLFNQDQPDSKEKSW